MTSSGAGSEEFRLVSNRLPKGVAVVSARWRGLDVARTVTDLISVSWEPPTMLVSLYSLGRIAEAVEGAGRWALSFLAADQRGTAQLLAEPGMPTIGLLDQIAHHRSSPDGPALIDDALAHIELETTTTFEVATHTLFVGRVTAMSTSGRDEVGALVREWGSYPPR